MQKSLSRLFSIEGYKVEIAENGPSAVALFYRLIPQAVVLDLKLPGLSGKDVFYEMRRNGPPCAIVILSALSEVDNKVELLELGVDDYVTKPFSPRELLARVRVAMRRVSMKQEADTSSFGNVVVDFARMQARRGDESVRLSAQEFKLLKYFSAHPDRVLTRKELLEKVWGYNCDLLTRTVDNQLLKLRQKLEPDPSNPVHFKTVHGVGYRFIPSNSPVLHLVA